MTESSPRSAAAYTQLAKTTLQLAHVSQLLRLFHQANLPLILIKGIALVERVYPAAEQRSMQDIDVLVRRADFERAAVLLQTHGYQFSNKASLWNEAFAREFMGNVAYNKTGVAFDVHWHPVTMSWFRATTAFDLDGLWSRAIPTEIAGAPALRLCPEDEILHLCYHTAVHHGLTHPHGVRDILGVLRVERDTLNWAVLAERARAWRVSVAVWAALNVARSKMQDARGKGQEARNSQPGTRNSQLATRNSHHAAELIPEYALDALRVPRWRQRLLRPFVQRAMAGQAAMVSGTMRFLGVLLVDRARDLPAMVWRGLFPGRRWLQLRYDLSPRQAFWRQFAYPLEVLARGAGALLHFPAQ
ncbi:MAG TPA: nucleotidyltransferase family protein [Anaerolineae bacterium]|nr:nucleotidyltransferase family protein [Anaerolineae bacterium]